MNCPREWGILYLRDICDVKDVVVHQSFKERQESYLGAILLRAKAQVPRSYTEKRTSHIHAEQLSKALFPLSNFNI